MRKPLKPPRPPSTPEERRQWISRYRSSGLTQVRFAPQHGLKVCTLQAWLYRPIRGRAVQRRRGRAKEDASHPAEKLAVSCGSPRPAPPVTFREVSMPALRSGGSWAAEIQLPNGIAVRLWAMTSAAWIESLLGAVRQAC
jgi:hypothetical protein